MQRKREASRLVVVALLAGLAGCHGCEKKAGPSLPPRDGKLGARRCPSTAGPRNKNLPIFNRPFDNQFTVVNLFDHRNPGDFKPFEGASKELTYCGLELFGLLEGMDGYTWAMPTGTHILSVADGEVVVAGAMPEYFCPQQSRTISNELVVTVVHEGLGGIGYSTTYRNLSKLEVKVGDQVKQGSLLGLAGQSGCAGESELYFVVHRLNQTKNTKPTVVDPYGWDGVGKDPWEFNPNGAESLYLWNDNEAPTLGGRGER